MFPSLRGRGRFLILGLAVTLTLFYYMTHSSVSHSYKYRPAWIPSDPNSETARLEKYMNDGPSLTTTSPRKSSFDWSSVKFAYPPVNPVSLPRGARKLPPVQHIFKEERPAETEKREARRREVKKLFQKNWQSYRKHAWGKDALQPVSGTFKDQFSGWAATLVDAVDTLWIMGLREEFDEAVAYVAGIDFGKSSTGRVNMFETTIRYLGGLLSAYDLSKREVLLQKATELGDLLYAGFNTENRMPVDFIDFEKAKTGAELLVESNVVSASPGTLSMEMTHLSQVTGDSKYYDAVLGVMRTFAAGQDKTRIPGVWPIYVSMMTKDVSSGLQFTLGGSADSLYEYLPKMHALLGGGEPMFESMSKKFLKAASENFFFRPMLPNEDDILISGAVNAPFDIDEPPTLDPESEHLTCFIGGTVALGGKLLGQEWDVQTGARLAKGCAYVYKSFPTGIGPERWNMIPCEPVRAPECKWNETKWNKEKVKQSRYLEHLPKGFTTAKDPRYLLRPEAVESLFVLYRMTGEIWYQDAAWDMFKSIAEGTATEFANAAVLDVTKDLEHLPQEDYMEVRFFLLQFSCQEKVLANRRDSKTDYFFRAFG